MKKKVTINSFISIVVLLSMVLSLFNPGMVQAAAPTPPVPTKQPGDGVPQSDEVGLTGEHTAPVPGTANNKKLAGKAMEKALNKVLEYWGPRYQTDTIKVEIEGDWARGVADWKSNTRLVPDSIQILAHHQPDGTWQAVMPGSGELYLLWLTAIPTSLVPALERSQLIEQDSKFKTLSRFRSSPMLPLLVPKSEHPEGEGGNKESVQSTTTPMTETPLMQTQINNSFDAPNIPKTTTYTAADTFQFPLQNYLVTGYQFGQETSPGSYHLGEDADGSRSTPVYAAGNGYVQKIFFNTECKNYGTAVIIEHRLTTGDYVTTVYGHLRNIDLQVTEGEIVKGQLIGFLGNYYENGCWPEHLHFGIRNGSYSNTWVYWGYGNSTVLANWLNPTDFINSHLGSSTSCSAPSNLKTNFQENDGVVSPSNTLTFSWAQVSCSGQNGYLVRVGTYSGGSNVVSDYSVQGLQTNYTFGSQWYNQDLYWSVRANASGAPWSSSRRFRIEPNQGGGCSPYISNFTFNPVSPSNTTNVTVTATISTSFPNFRAARLTVDGSASYCEQTGLPNFTCNWDTRSTPDGDHTIRIEVDDTIGSSWDAPQTCSSTYHLDTRPSPIPVPPVLQNPGDGTSFNEGQSIDLSWSSTGDQYYGEFWGGPGGTISFDWQSGTSKSIGSQWAGYLYYWHVKARNSAGESGWSNTRTFTVKPGAPSNLTAVAASCNQINLSWNDNSGNEEGYKIYRNGIYLGHVGANATSYQDTGLSGNTPYSYTVKAYRGAIDSNSSNTSSTSTPSCVVIPSVPSLQSPSSGTPFIEGQEITLCWSASGNEYYGEVMGGPDGTQSFGWQSGTCKNIDIGALLAGYTYSWHVKARNSAGISDWSSTWTFTIKPGAPTGLIAQAVACDQINLSWDDNSDNEEGYDVYRNGSYYYTLEADSTSYQNTGLSADSDYSYFVKAFRGSIESSASATVTAHTPTCPPVDIMSPVVTWTEPVMDDGVYDVVNQTIQLGVDATDDIGVAYVRFYRWDAVNLQYVEIGNAYTAPYQVDIECASLNLGWNQILVDAYDATGNGSDTKSIWLNRLAPQPDLVPFTLSGYSDAVVLSSVPGTHESNELYAGQSTYFDCYFLNNGWESTNGSFNVELWIDDALYITHPFENFDAGNVGGFDDWVETIPIPGWHYVTLVVDPENAVEESDETNNTWGGMFYWWPSAPYYDDMENGPGNWSASGLWHLIDATNPYATASSGFSSWWYGQDDTGNYDTGVSNSGDLFSPIVYIPDTGYYLRFSSYYETETQSPDWDRRTVQISVDGGDFTNIYQLYDDQNGVWLGSQVIDLSGYAGHLIQVKFNFDTLDAVNNNYRGWYVDDFEISDTPPPSCADMHEPNNIVDQATAIDYGQTFSADICPGGDLDFYQFQGYTGDQAVIDVDATILGSSLDSYVDLIDSDGTTILWSNDDADSVDSLLGYQLTHDGIFYIKVKSYYHPSVGDPDQFYNLSLYTDSIEPVDTVIDSPVDGTWIDPNFVTVSVSAIDEQSGIERVEFLWHGGDWETSDWVWLGADTYGSDGWSINLDTSSLSEQTGGAFYVWAFDYAGNYGSAGAWDLGIDRTAPWVNTFVNPMYGDAPFRDFYVTWEGTDDLSGVDTYGLQYKDGSGSWTDLVVDTQDTYYHFLGANGHTYYFRGSAIDKAGNLSEYSSTTTPYTVQTCSITSDPFENDNTMTSAKTLPVTGASQVHNFHAEGNQDWVKFYLTAGTKYAIQSEMVGAHADTVLTLYDASSTELDANDDYELYGLGSRILFAPTTSATYYAKVNHWDPYGAGCTTEYTLKAYPVQANFVATPLVGSAPLSVAFTNLSTGEFSSYLWDFGDGATSIEQHPSHVYTAAGSYTVMLSVDGMDGPAMVTKSGYIAISGPTLSVSKTGTGSGSVTSDPVGINCGSTCSFAFTKDTVVTLTASPATGSTFAGWSGVCTGIGNCQVTMNESTSVTASFTATEYSLSITSAHGTVVKNPNKTTYHYGDMVQLAATPAAGWLFASWSGDVTGAGNPVSLEINGNKAVTANYTPIVVVPVITNLSPVNILVNSPNINLIVTGSGFLTGATVLWNGEARPTSIVNSTRLIAELNAVDLAVVNAVEVKVRNPGLEESNTITVKIHSFADVLPTHPLWRYVEGFFAREITTGCAVNPMRYCPDRAVTRGEMAVFLLRSMHVDDVTPYEPADDPADPFADVPTPGKDWMEPWIEQFYATGITTGCGVNPLRYCPERNVTRGEMAVFLLRAKHGSSYTPPPATGTFADVPTSTWMAAWIEQFYKEGITTGCAVSPLRYCPDRSVNRAEMATFVDRAFEFPQIP